MCKFSFGVLFFALSLCASTAKGQWSDPWSHLDPAEVRLPATWQEPEEGIQKHLRVHSDWAGFHDLHPRWQVVFDQSSGSVLRAFGPAVTCPSPTLWLDDLLDDTAWSVEHAEWQSHSMGKHVLYHAKQTASGRTVVGTQLTVKSAASGVVMWGAKVHPQAVWPETLSFLDDPSVAAAATAGIDLTNLSVVLGEECLVPMRSSAPEEHPFQYRPARTCEVRGQSPLGIPVIYRTLVDLENGAVLQRENRVHHLAGGHGPKTKETQGPKWMGPPAILQMTTCQVVGTVHLTQPFEPTSEVGLGYLLAQTNDGSGFASPEGMLVLEEEGEQTLNLSLSGLYSTVTTNGVTPDLQATIDGDTTLTFDDSANLRQLSAYHSVNRIHDHMQLWLPGFTGLDVSMPTIVDVNGTCNAFYTPGSPSVNFYSEGDGCNAFSVVSDVVFHEYGHGINDVFYESLGGNFSNGATNEGYADFWAISLTDNPILGLGCYSDDPNLFIRRYDIDPKVYPQDLVGEVHADGEIICGAWYDTHLLMGADWEQTMTLFTDAFAGLQAQAANGNEGEVYVQILLDVLQADDDNADLSDGTPNGEAILEGFGIHGISLFSSVDIEHQAALNTEANEAIVLEITAPVMFPFGQFFNACEVHYRTAVGEEWTTLTMEEGDNDQFFAELPAQEEGTVVEYHFGITDLFGAESAITPYSAGDIDNPNLPFNLIVGLTPVLIDDQDDHSQFGFWNLGLPSDNATTGEWESTIPVGSFSTFGDPSTICAPTEDHTPGDGLYAFITGVSPGPDAGIGSNDVDGGSTTLQSESLDLSDMTSPVLSYWRWYVNAPASGANPGTDWWQVDISSDGGENWIQIEETLTQDISWRRNAFAVTDYIPLTDNVKLRFVASDSLRLNQELDGGSLIEAGLDDLVIYDVATSQVADPNGRPGVMAWPVPADQHLHSAGWMGQSLIHLVDLAGRTLCSSWTDPIGQCHFEVPKGASGVATLQGQTRTGQFLVKKVLLRTQ